MRREQLGRFAIRVMAAAARPANDSIAHTGRHFLRPAEHWEECLTLDATGENPPGRLRSEALAAGLNLRPFFEWPRGNRVPPGIDHFWRGAPRDWLLRAHDDGYAPRYFGLLLRLPPIGAARNTGNWTPLLSGDAIGGFEGALADWRIVVKPTPDEPDTQFAVTSARRLVPESWTEKTTFSLGEQLSPEVRDAARRAAEAHPRRSRKKS